MMSIGLGGIHRQIGILEKLFEAGSVIRRDGYPDAGIARNVLTQAI